MKKRIPPLLLLLSIAGQASSQQCMALPRDAQKSQVQTNKRDVNYQETICTELRKLQSFKRQNEIEKYQVQEDLLSKMLSKIEQEKNLPSAAYDYASFALGQMAELRCPTSKIKYQFSGMKPEQTDEFLIGDQFKRRALSLRLKINPEQKRVVAAHREMLNWYNALGRTEEARDQFQILSRILNSSDPSVINPRFIGCDGACGKG